MKLEPFREYIKKSGFLKRYAEVPVMKNMDRPN